MEEIVEANVFHRAAILGEARAAAPGPAARLYVDGELAESAPVTVDVAAVLARVGGLLTELGLELRRGDMILAGSLTHVPMTPPATLTATIDGLGAAALNLKLYLKGSDPFR
jgi:hypothetical protein